MDLEIGHSTTSVIYPAEDTPHISSYKYLDKVSGEAIYNAPCKPGPFPVVLFSHGSHGYRLQFWRLMEGIAKRGYIVAAIDHYGTTLFDKFSFQSYRHSVSYRLEEVANTILHLNSLDNIEGHPLQRRFEKKKGSIYASIVGHSLGGHTALVSLGARNVRKLASRTKDVNYNNELRTILSTIDCGVGICPSGYSWAFGDDGLKGVEKPTLIVGSKKDSLVPMVEVDKLYAALEGVPKAKIVLENMGHSEFSLYNEIPLLRWFRKKKPQRQVAQVSENLAVTISDWLDYHMKKTPKRLQLTASSHFDIELD